MQHLFSKTLFLKFLISFSFMLLVFTLIQSSQWDASAVGLLGSLSLAKIHFCQGQKQKDTHWHFYSKSTYYLSYSGNILFDVSTNLNWTNKSYFSILDLIQFEAQFYVPFVRPEQSYTIWHQSPESGGRHYLNSSPDLDLNLVLKLLEIKSPRDRHVTIQQSQVCKIK